MPGRGRACAPLSELARPACRRPGAHERRLRGWALRPPVNVAAQPDMGREPARACVQRGDSRGGLERRPVNAAPCTPRSITSRTHKRQGRCLVISCPDRCCNLPSLQDQPRATKGRGDSYGAGQTGWGHEPGLGTAQFLGEAARLQRVPGGQFRGRAGLGPAAAARAMPMGTPRARRVPPLLGPSCPVTRLSPSPRGRGGSPDVPVV